MTIARRLVLDRRRSLVWWSVAIVGTVSFTAALWPSVRGQQQFEDLIQDLPEGFRALFGGGEGISFVSAPGYLHSRLFSTLFPLLLLVFGIGLGARAVGGSEEDGTLELVLAQPVSRVRVAAERYVALVLLVVSLGAAGVASLLVVAPFVGLLEGVEVGRVLVAGLALVGLALLHASLAFAVGCAVGRRGPAVAVAGAVAVASYLLQSLLAATEALDALGLVSPWHWYLDRNLLAHGATLAATLLPLVVAGALAVAGAWLFGRRDLRIP